MRGPRLSETSYVVLGLLEQAQPATPYTLKRLAKLTTDHFWALPHTQLYNECARLAREGLLSERIEKAGRRRRFYRLSARGRRALAAWREEPAAELFELRDRATLKLFFGADPAVVAEHQIAVHRAKLAEYEALRGQILEVVPPGQLRALDVGIAHERAMIAIWGEISVNRTQGV